MPDFVTLSCPSCGGKLEITSDIDRFACAHCGSEHIVKRGGGLISLSPVVEEIRSVRVGVDRTASELAIPRLTKEIRELEQEINKISIDRKKVTHELSVAEGCTGGRMTAIIVSLMVVIASFVWAITQAHTSDYACMAPVGGILVALVLMLIVSTNSKSADAVDQEIERRRGGIRRLQQTPTKKREELRVHRELVSAK